MENDCKQTLVTGYCRVFAYLDIERKGIQNYVIFLLPAAVLHRCNNTIGFSLGLFIKRSFKDGK